MSLFKGALQTMSIEIMSCISEYALDIFWTPDYF